MNKQSSLQIGEWYWICLEGFDGKPFGQILKKTTPKIVKIRLGIFRGHPVEDIDNPEMIIDVKYIGEKLTAEESVNIITKSLLGTV